MRFVETIQNTTANENDQSVILLCRLSDPTIPVEWRVMHTKTGIYKLLTSNSKYQITSDGSSHLLRISNVKKSDAGVYQCFVKNGHDMEIQTSGTLTVEGIVK